MTTTLRSDVQPLIPEVLADAVRGAFAGKKAMLGSPAVVSDFSLLSTQGGEKVQVPYFGTIGEFDDVSNEGDALTPAKITATEEEAAVVHAGKAFEITAWARMAATHADPYQEAARQIVEAALRKFDASLIAAAAASLPAGMIHDISAVGAGLISYDAVVDAKLKWGDEQEDIALMVMHSKVAGDLMKLKDSSGRPLIVMPEDGKLGSFVGMPLKISDRLAAVNGVYSTMLLKRGALALWANGSPSIKTDTDILADTEVAACHVYYVAHRYSRLPDSTKGGVVILKHK